MKENLRTTLLGLLALFSIYFYFLSATPLNQEKLIIKSTSLIDTQKEEKEALTYLNQLRVGAGLVPFSKQKELQLAAKNHANYLTTNFKYGHKELSSDKGFTGEYASSRILFAGYPSSQVIENVSVFNRNYKESIDGLFSAIYHRLAFLDFRSDTIGIGISQNKIKKTQTAFVYDMSLKALENLYRENRTITPQDINTLLNKSKSKNAKMVTYPYPNQNDVPPAFFDELPDPLPNYRVSGFPISVSFNSFYYKEAKLLKFQLFNQNKKEIKNIKIFDYKSDPNGRLKKLDFVLFPLERLAWNSKYTVYLLAKVDNELIQKEWSFTTQRFNLPLYVVNSEKKVFKLKTKKSYIFYFPPNSKVDLLGDVAYPANLDIEFIDKNTIKLTVLETTETTATLNLGKHQLKIETIHN